MRLRIEVRVSDILQITQLMTTILGGSLVQISTIEGLIETVTSRQVVAGHWQLHVWSSLHHK